MNGKNAASIYSKIARIDLSQVDARAYHNGNITFEIFTIKIYSLLIILMKHALN